MMKYKIDVGVMLYAFILGCLIAALLMWATGSLAATGDDEPAEQYNCPPGSTCARYPQ